MQLDQSHRIVLENLATFQRAQRCLEEADTYIQSVLQEIADDLSAAHAPQFSFYFTPGAGSYLQTRACPNWDGTGAHLITIGIERLAVAEILAPDSPDAARAYIYSELLNDWKRAASYTRIARHLRQLLPPDGFAPASPQMHGYVFVKRLAPPSVATLCDRAALKTFFMQCLEPLASWLVANAPQLAGLGGADALASTESV